MRPSILPVVVVPLMAVQTVWAGTVAVHWLIQHDWALWLRIVSGIRSAGLVAGAGFGLWVVTMWGEAGA